MTDNIKNIYFIGIGGIGMSALARYFLAEGVHVSGFDRTETDVTRALSAAGARIHFNDDVNSLDPDADIVVYTPAIPAVHTELQWYRTRGYRVVKRSDILQWITRNTYNICVAGTHGKTSISTMIAHLLRHSGFGCTAFLGGISVNYQTNFWNTNARVCVVEADEYDKSFLKLSPDMAVVTSMDPDHLDIYGTVEHLRDTFRLFVDQIKPDGKLIHHTALSQELNSTRPDKTAYRLSLSGSASKENPADQLLIQSGAPNVSIPDVYASEVNISEGGYRFNAHLSGKVISDIYLPVGGLHNVENMLAAMWVAQELGISEDSIKAAVASYQGVKRRFEYIYRLNDAGGAARVAIDDYAHHPAELEAVITSARQLFHGLRMTVVFQPHLYTRTRDLAQDFARVLQKADEVVLLPLYPARELPVEGISSYTIADLMPSEMVSVQSAEAWLKQFDISNYSLLIIAGAGDIDLLAPALKNKLTHQ